jgi:hypothetical protein
MELQECRNRWFLNAGSSQPPDSCGSAYAAKNSANGKAENERCPHFKFLAVVLRVAWELWGCHDSTAQAPTALMMPIKAAKIIHTVRLRPAPKASGVSRLTPFSSVQRLTLAPMG